MAALSHTNFGSKEALAVKGKEVITDQAETTDWWFLSEASETSWSKNRYSSLDRCTGNVEFTG